MRFPVAALELLQQPRVLRDPRVQQMQRDALLQEKRRIRQQAIDGSIDFAVAPRAQVRLQGIAIGDDTAGVFDDVTAAAGSVSSRSDRCR